MVTKKMKKGYVYILTNKSRTVLYIGVTSCLVKRIYEHKSDAVPGFTSQYKAKEIVYYEEFDAISSAIQREKQLKKWNRSWKEKLIEEFNPFWKDLFDDICQ